MPLLDNRTAQKLPQETLYAAGTFLTMIILLQEIEKLGAVLVAVALYTNVVVMVSFGVPKPGQIARQTGIDQYTGLIVQKRFRLLLRRTEGNESHNAVDAASKGNMTRTK